MRDKVTVTLNGFSYRMSYKEAKSLRDKLTKAIAEFDGKIDAQKFKVNVRGDK